MIAACHRAAALVSEHSLEAAILYDEHGGTIRRMESMGVLSLIAFFLTLAPLSSGLPNFFIQTRRLRLPGVGSRLGTGSIRAGCRCRATAALLPAAKDRMLAVKASTAPAKIRKLRMRLSLSYRWAKCPCDDAVSHCYVPMSYLVRIVWAGGERSCPRSRI